MKVPREATRKRKQKIKYCTFLNCPNQAAGATRYKGANGLCINHKGNPCKGLDPDGTACDNGAIGASGFCTNHGGNPCQYIDGNGKKCTTGARGATGLCTNHGGNPCQYIDG